MRRDPRKVWHMLEIRSTSSEVWFNFMDYVYEVVREPEVLYAVMGLGTFTTYDKLETAKQSISGVSFSAKIFRCEEVMDDEMASK